MTDKFPSYVKAYQYKGGFNKFVYDKLKELSGEGEEDNSSPSEQPSSGDEESGLVSISVSNNVETNIVFTLTSDNTKTYTKTTGSAGGGSITLPVGTYSVVANATGFNEYTGVLTVTSTGVELNITLEEVQN